MVMPEVPSGANREGPHPAGCFSRPRALIASAIVVVRQAFDAFRPPQSSAMAMKTGELGALLRAAEAELESSRQRRSGSICMLQRGS